MKRAGLSAYRFVKKSLSRDSDSVEQRLFLVCPGRLTAGLLFLAFPAWLASAAPSVPPASSSEAWPQLDLPQSLDFSEARALLEQQKWAEAAIVLRNLVRRRPDFQPAWLSLARALAYSGRREEALSAYAQGVSRTPERERKPLVRRVRTLSRVFLTHATLQLHQDGVNLLVMRKFRAAADKLDRALSQEPDNVEILTRLGQAQFLDGDADSASERLRLARKLNPHEPQIRLWLGRALHQRGELNEAADELRIALTELPRAPLAALWYAEALQSLGHRKAALQVLDRDVLENPGDRMLSKISLARLRSQEYPFERTTQLRCKADLLAAQESLGRIPADEPAARVRIQENLGLLYQPERTQLLVEVQKGLRQIDAKLVAISESN